MYQCGECGHLFDNYKISQEYMGECHGSPSYMNSECCPYCYSEDFTDINYAEEEECSEFAR